MGEKDKKTVEPTENEPTDETREDTEGHNLFTLSDYYVNDKIGRARDFEREARDAALVKEARARKKDKSR